METSLLQEWMASFHILSINAIIIYILKGTLFTVIISAIAVINLFYLLFLLLL